MDRPTCGTCPLFVPTGFREGCCTFDPPTIKPVPTDQGMIMGTVYPQMAPTMSACRHHPKMPDFIARFVPPDQPDPNRREPTGFEEALIKGSAK